MHKIILVSRLLTMFHAYFILICSAVQVHSYVLLQVSKDEQNRSNVDALIHKVMPAEEFQQFAKKMARKQFADQYKEPPQRQDYEDKVAQDTQSESSESQESKAEKVIEHSFKRIMNTPEARSKTIKLSPEVFHFRSKPSLVYSLDSSTLVEAIKDFLSSKVVARYTDAASEEAAAVYTNFRAAADER